jgi:hypothetical protein
MSAMIPMTAAHERSADQHERRHASDRENPAPDAQSPYQEQSGDQDDSRDNDGDQSRGQDSSQA